MNNVNLFSGDYNNLLSGTNNQSSPMTSLIGDYKSIKNGSYGKLMKAYYGEKGGTKPTKAQKLQNDTATKALNKVQTTTDDLKKTADSFLKKENVDLDSVKAFINDYNEVIKAANNTTDKSVVDRTTRLVSQTMRNYNLLGSVGISLNEDSTLKIDEETFNKASKATVDTLFKGVGSFAYGVSSQASLINSSADRAVSKLASSTYTAKGDYETETGKLYNSFT